MRAILRMAIYDQYKSAELDLSLLAEPSANRVATAILHAILAHLYIAWIHPIGDGNGGGGDFTGFILYALQGLADGLQEQCNYIDEFQLSIAWQHFVFARFRNERRSPALNRRRELVLALTNQPEPVPRAALRHANAAVAELYAGKTDKTLTRDINWLVKEDLIERQPAGYGTRIDRMRSFRPPRAQGASDRTEERP